MEGAETLGQLAPFEHEGCMLKRGNRVRTWKWRYFGLKNRVLYYFLEKKEQLKPKGMILLGSKVEQISHIPDDHRIQKAVLQRDWTEESVSFLVIPAKHRDYVLCGLGNDIQIWLPLLQPNSPPSSPIIATSSPKPVKKTLQRNHMIQQSIRVNIVDVGIFCRRCSDRVEGAAVGLDPYTYHVKCFECVECSNPLAESCMVIQDDIYCDGCARRAFIRSRLKESP